MTLPFDVDAVRADFPILETEIDGHPLVYLDSGATSQKPRAVLDAERDFLERANSAVHRGAHTLAAEATELFEDARVTVAEFVGAEPEQLVWTSGATAGLNLVAGSLGYAGRLREDDEIVVTEAEHHANLIPWQELAARTGTRLRHIPVLDDGTLDMHAAADLIGERTKIVAFPHVSNVLGIVNPVAKLVTLARGAGALTVLDACQSAPHLALDLPASGVDLAVFSGHKVHGPYGIGALWGRDEVLESLPPFTFGGSMITTVTLDKAEYLPPPQRFEPGTQPVSQAVAFAAALRWLGAHDLDAARAHEAALERRMRDGLRSIDGIRLLGDTDTAERVALQAFSVEGVHAHDVGQFLDSRGVAVRVGHHCAQPLHRRFGVTASVRASAAIHTTEAEVDTFLDAVSGVRGFFGVASPAVTTGAGGPAGGAGTAGVSA
ncbi:cysteine desulfurase/selenocysteine lyase [Microbacterium sp. SORGH_AS 1204]|uniref:aminotransferase class V-fold PLP-dependent enzyme n=1 Tax=Microbacterium sp. SORGH_AS_1204 TaxID=3041785 RepID=UPI00278D4B6B|nr:SufS family cysteine desulfurase [Microbacterium sp. SORGH_AS_1204]MDQ1138315.1 cysteine desulfurase/selenocysteine lyase [Microbacterium sp. SORGH_AS_1204]